MFNISLNVLLFHHFNVDQDVQQIYCYHGKKTQNKTKQKQNLFQLWRFKSVPIFSFWIYIIFISFSLWRQNLREKNNTSCKTCLVINLEIKIIQFPLTPVPISPCIFPCTVLFVESASSHRSARSLETLFFWLQYVGQVRKTYNEKDHNETKWLKMHSQNTSWFSNLQKTIKKSSSMHLRWEYNFITDDCAILRSPSKQSEVL